MTQTIPGDSNVGTTPIIIFTMTLPAAKTSKEYPLYMLGYFIVIYAIAFLISAWSGLTNLSPDGKYIQYYPCLETDTDDYGREYCSLQDKAHPNHFVPAGAELVSRAQMDAVLVGLPVLGFGIYGWKKKREEEKRA